MKRRDLSTPLSVSSFDFEHKKPKKRGTREDRKNQKAEQAKGAPEEMNKKQAAPIKNDVDSKKNLLKREWTYENTPGLPTRKATQYSPANENIKNLPIYDSKGKVVGSQLLHKKKGKK